MRVVHISTLTTGGAGLCTKRLHHALLNENVDSQMLVAHGEDTGTACVAKTDLDFWYSNAFLGKVKHLLMRMNILKDREYWDNLLDLARKELSSNIYISHPFSNYKSIVSHPLVRDADIIHLHWVTGFVDFPLFFPHIKKPIVWTLHDENLGLGMFHLTSARNDCPESLRRLDNSIKKIKHQSIAKSKSMNLVAISETMRNFIQGNDFLSQYPVTLIHNGIEPETFQLLDRNECRRQLELPVDNTILLFSAHDIQDANKGLDKLIVALTELNDCHITLVCLGKYTNIPSSTIDIRCVGRIDDSRLISSYYSAADYYVMSSQQESFSQTVIESMACGTPVVAFPTGIVPELITENNGIKCKDFTTNALAEAVLRAKEKHFDRESLRKQVVEQFDYPIIARQYITLYESILAK